MNCLARVKQKQPAPLVSVNLVFSREEMTGIDIMGRAWHLDRGEVVRRALDLLVLFGSQVNFVQEPGAVLAQLDCPGAGACG